MEIRSLAALTGQDRTCVDVYRLVITRPRLGAAEIAGQLGVGEREVRDALAELARLAVILPADGEAADGADGPAETVAVHPEVGLAPYIHRREEEILSQQRELASVRALTAELSATFTAQRSRRTHGVERLDGVHRVRARTAEMARRATGELLALMPGGAHDHDALESSRPLDEPSLSAGVALRSVYLDSARGDRATADHVRRLAELGGEIRTAPALPLRMLIADRSAALLPLDPEDTRAGAVVVHEPGVIAALLALFETVWDTATALDTAPPPATADGPSPQEAALLKLLAQGLTDEVASRRLGLSLRTTRRLMAGVAGRLGARSRFEAAVLASRAGWL